MPEPCTVLIGAPDLLPALKSRAHSAGELIAFSDADALQALEEITRRRPDVVALERLFAATSRGAALINRIKADPALVDAEIRVISHDSDYVRVSPRHTGPPPAEPSIRSPRVQPLDQRGTRRAARHRVSGDVEVLVDGGPASLVDLSTNGMQVLLANALKPNQRVQVSLADAAGTLRFNGTVAWARFEIPPQSGPRYRSGIEFVDADADQVEALGARHRI